MAHSPLAPQAESPDAEPPQSPAAAPEAKPEAKPEARSVLRLLGALRGEQRGRPRELDGRRVLWSFAIAMLILVGVGAASWMGALRLADSDGDIERSYRRLSAADRLEQLLLRAEDGHSAFLLTGREEFLEPLQKAQMFWPLIVVSLSQGERARPKSMARLRPLIERRLNVMERSIALRRARGLATAAQLVTAGGGRLLMEQIRGELDAITQDEEAQISLASARAGVGVRWVLWITGVGGVWALLLAGLSVAQLHSDIRRREAAEAEAEQGRILLEQFVKHAPAPVAMFDATGQPVLRSRRWQFDIEGSRLLTDHPTELMHANGAHADRNHNGSDGGAAPVDGPAGTWGGADRGAGLPVGWSEAMGRCLGGHVERREEDVVERAGRRHWVRWEMRPWQSSGGGIGGAIAFIENITERKQAEEKLRSSEARYREVMDSVHEIIFRADESGRWSFLNQAWQNITGSPIDAALGTPITDWIAPSDRAEASLALDALMSGRLPEFAGEVLMRARRPASTRDTNAGDGATSTAGVDAGQYWRCEVAARAVVDAGGRVVGVTGTLTDVSQRRRAEDAQRASERELRALFAAMNEIVIVLGRDGTYLRIAPTRPELLIAPPEQLIGRNIRQVAPELAEPFLDAIARALSTQNPVVHEYRLDLDGREVWFQASVAPLADDSVLWVARDISAQKREEQRQDASREGLRAILDATDELLGAPDVDTLLRRAVELGREKFGLERTGLFLVSPGERHVRGTYGTDLEGRTVDERTARVVIAEGQRWRDVWAPVAEGERWTVCADHDIALWDGHGIHSTGRVGEVAVTLIQSSTGVLGSFHNDNAISGRMIDRDRQELIAVYCSVLGNLIQSKRGEEALRIARDDLEMRVRSRTSELMLANDELQLEVAERKRAQAQEAVLSRGLRSVLACADELLPIEDLDVLLRRAIELGRDMLGLERCSIFLLSLDGEHLQGTYGINLDGRNVAQHRNRFRIGGDWFDAVIAQTQMRWLPKGEGEPHFDWDEQTESIVPTGTHGWGAMTPIHSSSGACGVMFNDAAISGAPLEQATQDAVALFASLLGSIIERKRAEGALRESEARLRGLFESMPQIIWTAGTDGVINYHNSQWHLFSGQSPEQSAGRGWEVCLHPEDDRWGGERWKHSLQTGEELSIELRLRRWDGIYRWHLSRALPVRSQDGEIVSWIGSSTDIDDQKKAADALRESEARFRMLTDSLPQVVWTASAAGAITYVNKVAQLYDHAPLEGGSEAWDWRGLIHPDDLPPVNHLWAEIAEDGHPAALECRLRLADGSYRWHLGRVLPLLDESGEMVMWIGSATDIDDQKRAQTTLRRDRDGLERIVEERTREVSHANVLLRDEIAERQQTEIALRTSEERFRRFMNTSTFVAFMKDPEGRYIFVNDALCRAFDTTPQDWLGHATPSAMRREDALVIAAHEAQVLEGEGTVTALERAIVPDGSERVWLSYKFPLRDVSGAKYLGGLAIEVTEQQRAERDLRNLTEELKRSNADLEQFAYVASHDLQEPLRMVVSYLQLLERRHGKQLEGDAREFIDFATDGARRMQSLINDLLDYSRLGRRGKQFEPVDLNQVLAGVLHILSLAVAESGARVEHEPLPTVIGDSSQIARLLQNLLANALKFRGQQAPIIHISCRDAGEAWEISVRDNGIGVAPEHSERIFAVFGRLHSREEYAGTGIGLAVVKKIAERHGGGIRVQSARGAGAEFLWSVPKEKAAL